MAPPTKDTQKGKKLNPFQHARKRPDTYIGSISTIERNMTLLLSNGVTETKELLFNPGLFNIIKEGGSNIIDNVWRSVEKGIQCKLIQITINEDNSIELRNDGLHIPVEKTEYEYKDHRTGDVVIEEKYPAEMYFGDMFTGTNYDDDEARKTSGRNGMGSKAMNVFSKFLTVEHTDPLNHKKFIQTFSNAGQNRTDPEITSYRGKAGYTSVTMLPDYKYFSFPDSKSPGLTDDFIGVIRMYAAQIAMITSVAVKFTVHDESQTFKIPNLEKYVKLIHPGSKTMLFTSPNGDECVVVQDPTDDDTLTEVRNVSFVNGIQTFRGGIHVDAWSTAVMSTFVREFNNLKGKGKTPIKTTAKDVYPYLEFYIRSEVDRPMFDSQTKERLTEYISSNGKKSGKYTLFNGPKEKKEWTELLNGNITKLLKWTFVKDLVDKILSKAERTLSTKEKQKKRFNFGESADDANLAGKKGHSQNCTLYVTEGMSAKTLATKGISSIEKGQDLNGSVAIRGKFLNVRKASKKTIIENKEVQMLNVLLGLVPGVDYSLEKNREQLRYGKLCGMTDADDDGLHILGLLINFLDCLYPGLIKHNFFSSFSTPVIILSKGKKQMMTFYSNYDFQEYIKEHTIPSGVTVTYLKGLGSIPSSDAPSYFSETGRKMIDYVYSKKDSEAMEMVFSDTKPNKEKRKQWIMDEDLGHDEFMYEGKSSLRDFVNGKMILYSRTSLVRAIPSLWDGLKECGRKILYTFFEKGFTKEAINMERLSGAVKEVTGYHHGSVSVNQAIVVMGTTYVGSNNAPLAYEHGSFKTRLTTSDDSANPRYLSSMATSMAIAMNPASDFPLLENNFDEGQKIEYKHFVPIVPQILLNGTEGIATGYSTTVPCYKPHDIIHWIKTWLNDPDEVESLDDLTPWYRGFQGSIYLDNKTPHEHWYSSGILENVSGNKWIIRELPIGMKTSEMKEYLEYLESGIPPKSKESSSSKKWAPLQRKMISELKSYNTPYRVHFEFKSKPWFTPNTEEVESFGMLVKSHHLTNMVLLDSLNRPLVFESPESILKMWCPVRLRYYKKRKRYVMKQIRDKIPISENRYRFVKAVVDKKLDLYQDDETLDRLLSSTKWKFDKLTVNDKKEPSYDYLLSMQMRSMTQKKLNELSQLISKLKTDLAEIRKMDIKDMWREDLDKFISEVNKFYKEMEYIEVKNYKKKRRR